MRKILPLLALALCCLSCYAPFDLSMSLAAATIGKLTYENTVGPIYNLDGDERELEYRFLPDKLNMASGIDFQNGFLAMEGPTRSALRYVHFVGGATPYNIFGWQGMDYFNPTLYARFQVEPLKFQALPISRIGLFDMDPLSVDNRRFSLSNADAGLQTVNMLPDPNIIRNQYINLIGPGALYDADVLGMSIYPTDIGSPQDATFWLVRVRTGGEAGKLREVRMELGPLGMSNKVDTRDIGAIAFDIAALGGVERCLYYHDPDPIRGPTFSDRKSYVSWFDESIGGWRCISWKGVDPIEPTPQLPGITHRIDALLTNGMLFSTEDGTGRLYDSSGTLVNTFPLGSLRLVGERFINGVPTVVFSMARIYRENDSRSLFLDLYSIPTTDLAEL